MKKGRIQELFNNLIVVIIISIILISILAVIYSFTQEKIKINETIFKKKAMLIAAGFAIPENYNDLIKLYEGSIKEIMIQDKFEIYTYINNQIEEGNILSEGYVIIFSGPGLWGEITAALAIASDLETLAGIEFISQNETPGLGGRIVEDWFKKQFRGKKKINKIVGEKEKPEMDQISSITGATNTTNYVLKLIESGKDYLKNFILQR
ncbi:MAG: FMN-binding protein [Exilispira sp.]